ncbi:diguanylate cyclase (GGDEF)-like protein/PAS domain S-box-containing protein [Neorhizobium huautlense]|uniref:Diguanylate cyclase (GGDEF)-like protein/PAS domain S-box-containing protein n=2 Tax=Neorhizobium huautlense TaxID=67774 RepID=A0ABT9PW84_9HYPH|nr:diguanylate cyclase (GGDEF)-like protein/PAS domain S-box-containing protein [Neorhizobium huautlense]
MFGLPEDQVHGVSIRHLTHGEDVQRDFELRDEILSGARESYTVEKRYIRLNETTLHARTTVIAMLEGDGRGYQYVSQIEDISNEKEADRQLKERAAQLELAMHAINGGFWHMDVRASNFQTSKRLAEFIAGEGAMPLNLEAYLKRVHVGDEDQADLSALLRGDIYKSVAQYRLDTIDGERWIRCDRRLLRDDQGKPMRIVGVAMDFTEEHRRLDELERSSQTDTLTGLLNRRGLQARYPSMSSYSGYALFTIDLDGFKQINDTLGHATGDAVLVETAARLLATVRETDLVCRTGGDEFVVIIAAARDQAQDVAGRIVGCLEAPINSVPQGASVSASVGGVWSAERPERSTTSSRYKPLRGQSRREKSVDPL